MTSKSISPEELQKQEDYKIFQEEYKETIELIIKITNTYEHIAHYAYKDSNLNLDAAIELAIERHINDYRDRCKHRLVMSIHKDTIKKLRQRTGLGVSECKKAFLEADLNFEIAVDILKSVRYRR